MKCTYSDMKAALPESKSKIDSIWCKIWVRKLALLLATFCQNVGISANTVSVIAVIVAFVAGTLLSVDNPVCRGAGVVLLVFWVCIDCIDGNLARYNKTGSLIGEFFDAIGGYSFYAASYIGIGIAAFRTTEMVSSSSSYIFIVIGAVCTMCDLLARLVYQKYTANMYQMAMQNIVKEEVKKDIDLSKRDFSLISIIQIAARELGEAGFFGPLLALAAVLKHYDLFLLFYTVYSVGQMVFAMVRYMRKASAIGKELFNK